MTTSFSLTLQTGIVLMPLSSLAVSPSKNRVFGHEMLLPWQHMMMNHAVRDMVYKGEAWGS